MTEFGSERLTYRKMVIDDTLPRTGPPKCKLRPTAGFTTCAFMHKVKSAFPCVNNLRRSSPHKMNFIGSPEPTRVGDGK
jgi:hypothetical protein